ncbi:hypothetical protein BJN34_17250 [Cupriavidus necator]|uniref:Uncharacterized protein n=1 Tax=Cupriavidus necator TaxID=106590 RepID=A0A1U9USN2_CUPNE|nr:hypothetical protein BJN34_17250 [Cupriavidus necator]
MALAALPWPAAHAARLEDVARIIDAGMIGNVATADLPATAGAQAAAQGPTPPNLFPAFSWEPPPAPPPDPVAIPVPKPRPGPPPMPFQVSAMWRYQGQPPVIAMQAFGNTYLLCERCGVPGHHGVGAVLEREYRIDRIAQSGVTLTYLPMRHVSVVPVLPRPPMGSQ